MNLQSEYKTSIGFLELGHPKWVHDPTHDPNIFKYNEKQKGS